MSAAPLPTATGIVLAGGRSSRFGTDKLLATVEGRPLAELAVLALAQVSRDLVLVLAPGAESPVSPDAAASVPLDVVRDSERFGGPLVGLLAGLERAREPLAVVAGGDMPSLEPAVLGLMLRTLDHSARDVVALSYRARPQPLPLALRVGASTPVVQRLVGSGERSLRALVDGPGSLVLQETEWRPLDPSAETLRDIDRPEDLVSR
jgi:molybdopterin-guanine dinucleotide biosynthesis protein A